MNPEQLVEKLEALGFVDERTLKMLRREIENPNKNASVKKILNYLVKKGHLTTTQAKKILEQSSTAPKPVVHDELEVRQPPADGYDTDDLTADVVESVPQDDSQATQPEPSSPTPEVPPAVVVPPAPVAAADPVVPEVVAAEPVLDPLATQLDPLAPTVDPVADPVGYDSGPVEQQTHQVAGFQGKRDQSNQWQNKWLFIAFGILGMLLIVGALLWFATSLVTAEDRFSAVMKGFEDGAYKDTINKAEDFMERYPNHEKIPKVKVVHANALLADTYQAKNWDETIKRAETVLPPLVEDETVDLSELRGDLAVMLPKSALNIAKRALKQPTVEAMKKELEMDRRAKKVVDTPAFVTGLERKKAATAKLLDELENTIAQVEGQIRKEEEFVVALNDIQGMASESKTDAAFKRYNDLIREYGDLAARDELRQAMLAVSAEEQKLITHPQIDLNVSQSPRPSPIAHSVMLASLTGEPIESLSGEVLPILADGSVYGIDLAAGEPQWRHFVGYQTVIQPQVLDPQTFIMADQRNGDLMRVRMDDGSIVWRAEIGEEMFPPTINEDPKQIMVTTQSGTVMKLDPDSGNVVQTAKLPQPAGVNLAFSQRNPYVYQPGYHSNLYVLSSEDLSCQEVYYLGHYPGSISIPPVFWSGYILVAVNGSDTCDLHILRPTEDGLGLTPIQKIRRITTGPVNSAMIRFGRWMLIAADNGDMKILELNTSNENSPISILAEEKFENRNGARAFLFAEGSQLWIAGKGIMYYKIQRALGEFNRQTIYNHGDYFLAPIHKYGDSLIHVRRRNGSAQFSVAAVNGKTLKEIWRSDIGGPLAGTPWLSGNRFQAITSQGDLAVGQLDQPRAEQIVKASSISEALHFDTVIPMSETTVVCVGPPGRPDLLFADLASGETKKLVLQRPANQASCRPVRLGESLIVCSRQGQVMRIDPRTGGIVGAPFLPPVRPGVEVQWNRPAVLGDSEFLVPEATGTLYLLSAATAGSLKKIAEMKLETEIKTGCVAAGRTAFLVAGSAVADELIAIDTTSGLKQASSFPLPAGIVGGPWIAGNLLLVSLENDQLLAFNPQLEQQWETPLNNDQFATPPYLDEGALVLVFRSGNIMRLDPAKGNIVSQQDLGQPVSHRPQPTDGGQVIGGYDGTIHTIPGNSN